MQKKILILGASSMAIAVILGALGAHALVNLLTEQQLHSFETGIRFQIYHSLALIILGFNNIIRREKLFRISANLFMLGIIFFSFSIYLLSLSDIIGLGSVKFILGPLTPIGGILLITGWIILAIAIYKSKEINSSIE